VRPTWKALLDGKSGIVSTTPLGKEFEKLPSRVAGLVPKKQRKSDGTDGTSVGSVPEGDVGWDSRDHVTATELHQSPLFTHYGLAASAEALSDAGFKDGKGLDPEMTGVCLGSGIGNLEDLYDTSLAYGEKVSINHILYRQIQIA
jgi:3-oxoacyl-[acyl-carrier-protein] synthase II